MNHFGAKNGAQIDPGSNMTRFGFQNGPKTKPKSIQAVQNQKGFKNDLLWNSKAAKMDVRK